jgi:hypothetical protein
MLCPDVNLFLPSPGTENREGGDCERSKIGVGERATAKAMVLRNKRLLSKSVIGDRKAVIKRLADTVLLCLQTAAFFPSGRSQIDTGKSEVGSQADLPARPDTRRTLVTPVRGSQVLLRCA